MYSFIINLVKRKINVAMTTKFTMQRACATIVITNMDERKSLGTVAMINYMPLGCVKTAILITTIVREEKTKRWLIRDIMS